MTEIRLTENMGYATFATRDISKGEIVLDTPGVVISSEEVQAHQLPLHCFQLWLNRELSPVDPNNLSGIFRVNHSCHPNCGIANRKQLVAMRDIKAGDQICFDYCMTDCSIGVPTVFMQCECHHLNCRGTITNVDWRNTWLQHKYKGFFSEYLQKIIDDGVE